MVITGNAAVISRLPSRVWCQVTGWGESNQHVVTEIAIAAAANAAAQDTAAVAQLTAETRHARDRRWYCQCLLATLSLWKLSKVQGLDTRTHGQARRGRG